MPERTYKEITGFDSNPIFLFEKEGTVFEGVFKSSKEVTVPAKGKKQKKRQSKIHTFEMPDKSLVDIWGCAQLDIKLFKCEPDSYLRITFLGKTTFDGKPLNNFRVERADN